jgi:hypothetical protein
MRPGPSATTLHCKLEALEVNNHVFVPGIVEGDAGDLAGVTGAPG